MAPRPSQLLVPRLWSLWNPVEALGLRPKDVWGFRQVAPQTTFREDRRGIKYHQGRIHHFVQCLQDGVALEPISIDNDCGHNRVFPIPVVLDGNHRFIAHIILEVPRIPAHYGGRVDLRRYLEGKRKNPPEVELVNRVCRGVRPYTHHPLALV